MAGDFLEWLNRVGGLVGAIGLVASLLSLWEASRARKAAKQAKVAAQQARDSIQRQVGLVSLSQVAAELRELKRLVRDEEWAWAQDRCERLRTLVGEVRVGTPQLKPNDLSVLMACQNDLAQLERIMTAAIGGRAPADSDWISMRLSDQITQLAEVRVRLERAG